jgi:hypothetical protein
VFGVELVEALLVYKPTKMCGAAGEVDPPGIGLSHRRRLLPRLRHLG